ncbi:MAG: hypothetical protein ACYDCQ_14235 [Dehalococcoidia bacterium]
MAPATGSWLTATPATADRLIAATSIAVFAQDPKQVGLPTVAPGFTAHYRVTTYTRLAGVLSDAQRESGYRRQERELIDNWAEIGSNGAIDRQIAIIYDEQGNLLAVNEYRPTTITLYARRPLSQPNAPGLVPTEHFDLGHLTEPDQQSVARSTYARALSDFHPVLSTGHDAAGHETHVVTQYVPAVKPTGDGVSYPYIKDLHADHFLFVYTFDSAITEFTAFERYAVQKNGKSVLVEGRENQVTELLPSGTVPASVFDHATYAPND